MPAPFSSSWPAVPRWSAPSSAPPGTAWDRIVAAASFHGGNLASAAPDSPHLVVGRITGRVVVAGAQDDDSFPAEQAELLEQALTEGGVDHTLETYPAHHGFAVPDNPTYDEAAAARHWQALEELYGPMLTD
jgi:carboxymethylenebutenolidase